MALDCIVDVAIALFLISARIQKVYQKYAIQYASSCTMKYCAWHGACQADVKHGCFFFGSLPCVHNDPCMLCLQAEALVQYLEEPLTQVAAS